MELDPGNRIYYIGYVFIGLSPGFLQGLAAWYFAKTYVTVVESADENQGFFS